MKGFFTALCAAGLIAAPAFAGNVPDSWSTGAPPDPDWEATSQAVLSQDLIVIADDLQATAQKLLRKKAIVALTPAQAAKFMGPADAGPPAASAPPSAPAASTDAPANNMAAPPATAPGDASAGPTAAQTVPGAQPAMAPSLAAPTLKAYLVRGILLQGAVGGFTAERKADALWVSYDGLAAAVPKAIHRALIVRLPSPPAHVYVTASFTN